MSKEEGGHQATERVTEKIKNQESASKPLQEASIPRHPDLEPEVLRLLSIRRRLREEKPTFVRQESWRYRRLKENWRRPRGKTSRVRLEEGGWPPRVKVGYGKPRLVRGLHPSGFQEILVSSPKDLEGLDPKRQAIRIAHTVGLRKRLKILEMAQKLGLRVFNPGPSPTPVAQPSEAGVKEEEKEGKKGKEGKEEDKKEKEKEKDETGGSSKGP
jgi:large subunit ribosomal protein L32e